MSDQRTRPYNRDNAGALSISEAEITFSAAAARQLIDTLPAGAVILSAHVEVLEAFNAGTSNLITVGTGAVGAGTADDILGAADVTEGTPGVYPATVKQAVAALTAETDIYVYYTPGDDQASTGKARARIVWARLADNA